jgi:predicted DsbA family dithiol-disulfide isomerase
MITIDIHSDVICPWCWIGKRRLEQALAGTGVAARATWHPFQLNPGMPRAGMPRAEYRRRKFGSDEHARALDARVGAVAAEAGLSFHLDLQQRTPNTLLAHRLIRLAGRRGVQDALVEALFSAYFSAGLDVGDMQVLAGIAAAHGLGAEEARAYLAGREDEDEVLAEDRAIRAAGIDGVPLFVIGGERVAGAQPVAVLRGALARAAAAPRPAGTCEDGLCRG